MSQPSSSQPPPPPSELAIKSILLLDDDTELADTLKQLLESRNFVVTTVAHGGEGLREVLEVDFDIIICDMMMPGMPGDMFFLAVQKTKPELAKRFIFVTGHADNPKVDAFLKNIQAEVLFKPVETEELVRTISLVLQRTGGL